MILWALTGGHPFAIVRDLHVADSYFSKLVGLQFRARLPERAGLLLVPCRSIHTCFVRFAMDVLMLDRQGRIVAVHPWIRPWRMLAGTTDTHAVLELPAGAPRLSVGDFLALLPAPNVRRSLQFLVRNDFQPSDPD